MSAVPTPAEAFARKYWTDLARGDLFSHFLVSQMQQVSSRYRPDEIDDLMNELGTVLQKLGYATTMAIVADQFEPTSREERAFWAGRYLLAGDDGSTYTLVIDDDGAAITLSDRTLSDHTFGGGTLRIGDDRAMFELALRLPASADELERPGFDLVAAMERSQPRCDGTMRLVREGRTIALRGKRGCFTPEGIDRKEDGDPPQLWAGTYALVFTDGKEWTWPEEALTLTADGGRLAVAFGSRVGRDVNFSNNCFTCTLDERGEIKLAARLAIEDDKARLTGILEERGTSRPLLAFQTERAAPRPRLRGGAGARVRGTTAFAIDVTKTAVVELPAGVTHHGYEVTLQLTGLPAGTPATYEWSITKDPAYPDSRDAAAAFDVTPNTDTTSASLKAVLGDDATGIWRFLLTVKSSTSTVYSIKSKVFVAEAGPEPGDIKIIPESLPPVVRNRSYSIRFVASGGTPPYTWAWEDMENDLGLLLVPKTGESHKAVFAGTVTDPKFALTVHTLVLAVTSAASTQPTRVALTYEIAEPDALDAEVWNWSTFVSTIAAVGFLIVPWLHKTIKRAVEGRSIHPDEEMAEQLKRLVDAKLNTPERYSQGIIESIALELNRYEDYDRAFDKAIEMAKGSIRRLNIREGDLEKKMVEHEIELENRAQDKESKEYKDALDNLERARRELDHIDKARKRTNEFKKKMEKRDTTEKRKNDRDKLVERYLKL